MPNASFNIISKSYHQEVPCRHFRSCFSTIHRLWCMLLVLLLTFCCATLSNCSTSSPVVFLCPSYPLFCLLLLYFLTFLKMCQMNLDCFFLNSLIAFLFSLTCFRMSSLVILSVHGTFSILLQNHISVASSYFSTGIAKAITTVNGSGQVK
jgi:hypothetical protein